jgi:hypothetical protein
MPALRIIMTVTMKRSKVTYSVHPGIAYQQTILDNLPEKTGKSLDQWLKLTKKDAPADDKGRIEWLKKNHKLGGTTAWLIVERAAGRKGDDSDPAAYLQAAERYVQEMYTGGKESLRPIHDALLDLGLAMGKDVKVCPCKTIVPLYRNHVFAEIKPATKTRIDFGMCLRDAKQKIPPRFKDTGGAAKGDRITHRVPISSVDQIDAEVKKWLKIAYDLDSAA